MATETILKFGIISTASILEYGFMPSVWLTEGVEADLVGSRDIVKAKQCAEKYGIPRYCGSYEEVLDDPGIDCVYVPLPNSMHAEWAKKALVAGKHVLCEKPVAWSAVEARSIVPFIEKSGKIFAEAFQYRYHPLMLKLREIIAAGEIGEVVKVEGSYCEIIPSRSQVQFRADMSGGALMDVGCYAVNFCRCFAGCDDAEVVRAESKIVNGVDGETVADLLFANGVKATVIGSILKTVPCYGVIAGTKGTIFIHDPFPSALYHGGVVKDHYLCILRAGDRIEEIRVAAGKLTYACQMAAFRDAVLLGGQPLIDVNEAIANMSIIDAILHKAGVQLQYPEEYKPVF